MRATIVLVGAAVAATVFQTTLGVLLAPLTEVVPNVMLVLAVHLGLRYHGFAGVVGAFVLGYVLDTFSGTVLGVHAAGCTAAYVVAYVIARTLWTEDGLPALVVVFLAALVYAVVVHGLVVVVDRAWPGWTFVLERALLQALLAVLVAPWTFRFLSWERRMLRIA